MKSTIKSVEDCIVDAADSFIYERSFVPTTTEKLASTCKRKLEGFKCIKEKLKSGVPAIVKRGMLNYVQGRQRYHKKYCTNVNSELSKSYTRDMDCLMKHKFQKYHELESILSNKAVEIERRNYNDSAPELKQICCALYTHRRNMLSAIGAECSASKDKIEELITETVSDDLSMVCEDEEKMISKVCPKLESLNVSNKFDAKNNTNSAGLFIYLMATLGEPELRDD